MRVLAVLSLIALSACASSGGSSSRPDETVRINGAGSSNLTLTSNTYAHVSKISAPVSKVWLAMPGAFEALSIPISTVDTIGHVIANDGLKLRRQLGKTPLGRYIDCGNTQIGENADSYDVHLTISVKLKADEGGHQARDDVRVDGQACLILGSIRDAARAAFSSSGWPMR